MSEETLGVEILIFEIIANITFSREARPPASLRIPTVFSPLSYGFSSLNDNITFSSIKSMINTQLAVSLAYSSLFVRGCGKKSFGILQDLGDSRAF